MRLVVRCPSVLAILWLLPALGCTSLNTRSADSGPGGHDASLEDASHEPLGRDAAHELDADLSSGAKDAGGDASQQGVDDAEAGACSADEVDCSRRVPLSCAGGEWVEGEECPFACVRGVCTGDCVPEAGECVDGDAMRCDETGTWQATVCQGGTPECGDGACLCSLTTCGDECLDTSSDPEHCGRCDRSCGGTTCTNGGCDARPLLSSAKTIDALTVSGPFLYFIEDAFSSSVPVYRVSTGGGARSAISQSTSDVVDIVADGSYIYAAIASTGAATDTIGRMPILGDFFTTLQGPSGSLYSGAIRTNATHVFIASTLSRSYIERVAKDATGQTRESVTSSPIISYTEFEVDDAYVYLIDSGAITRVVAGGGDPSIVVALDVGETIADIALSDDQVVFASSTRVARVEAAGGTAVPLDDAPAYKIVADATYAYFLRARGGAADCSQGTSIHRVAIAGAAPELIGVEQRTDCARELVLGDTGLYWLSGDSLEIRTVAK